MRERGVAALLGAVVAGEVGLAGTGASRAGRSLQLGHPPTRGRGGQAAWADGFRGAAACAMKPQTIVILVLAGMTAVFLLVGLAGFFLAA